MKKLLVVIFVFTVYFSYAQNNCLEFDGSDDFVNCGTGSSLDITDNTISVEAWIYPTDFKDASWKNTILANDSWSGSTSLGYVFRYGGAGGDLDFTFAYGSTGYNWASTSVTGVLSINTWQHVAAVYNGSNVKLYVDGLEKTSNNLTYNIESTDQPLNIGRSTGDPPGRLLKGKLDEIRIWDDARTPSEISDNMNNELTGSEQDLVAYYKLNEGSGQYAYDTAGNNDATLGSSSAVDSTDPSWITSDAPLPLTLSSFSAAYINSASTLSWTTQSENSNLGWNVHRSETEDFADGSVQNENLIDGAGTTSEPTDYTFTDPYPVIIGSTYRFWIESISFSGESEIFGPATLSVPNSDPSQNTPIIPEMFGLYQNYPNPFNPRTEISFAVEEAGNCKLTIYNVKGRKIKTLFTGNIEADRVYSVIWNGEDESGKDVASGIYYYKMKAGKIEQTKKMILLK